MNRTNGTPPALKVTSSGLTEVQRRFVDEAIISIITATESAHLLGYCRRPTPTVQSLTDDLERFGLPTAAIQARIWELIGGGELLPSLAWRGRREGESRDHLVLELELESTGQAPPLAAASLYDEGSRFPDPFADEGKTR